MRFGAFVVNACPGMQARVHGDDGHWCGRVGQ